ncbi:MAG: PDZ domain-containing protein [Acidobacteriota bacterium]|jgi:hypothetical protein
MSARMVVLLLSAVLLPQAAVADPVAEVVQRFSTSVVPVRYTLRPREAPEGGEGQKVEKVLCGVLVGPDGMVIISGDPFPDPGGDPRMTLDPVGFVVLEPGEVELPATALGVNRDLNLAYLRLDGGVPPGRQPVEFPDEVEAGIGDPVVVMGLLPERYDYAPTFWTGRISAILERPRRMFALTNYLQDLAIGGLALTQAGAPLGVVAEDVLPQTADLPSSPLALLGSISQGPKVGYPMVFPAPLFLEDLESPPAFEPEPQRSWFGITMQPLSRPLGDYWGIRSSGGIIVSSVLADSPAEGAGLLPGDVILGVDGDPVLARQQSDLASFREKVEVLPMGEEVPLSVWRAGEVRDVGIRPGTRPRTGFTAREFEDDELGITVREITVDVIQAQNLPPDVTGVVVSRLESAGWAQLAGVLPGDIILRVDQTDVDGLEAFERAIETARAARAEEIYFFLQRGIETFFVTVRTDW